jgi:hypothetical protein
MEFLTLSFPSRMAQSESRLTSMHTISYIGMHMGEGV